MTFDSREVGAGRLVRRDAGHRVTDGHSFVAQAFAAGAAGALVSPSRSTARTSLVADTSEALRALAPRSADAKLGEDHRRHRVGRQDQHQGSARRGARARSARAGPPLGQELQQPYRRAAEPRADAARLRLCGARNGHEQCRRDRRADPAGAAACRDGHRHRLRAHRESRHRGSDRRRQGRDLRRAGGRMATRSSPTTARTATGWSARRGAMPDGSSPSAAATPTSAHSRRPRRKRRQPDHRGAAGERADLHHRRSAASIGCRTRWRCWRRSRRSAPMSPSPAWRWPIWADLKGRGERLRVCTRRRRGRC